MKISMRGQERIDFLIQRDGKRCRFPGCKKPTFFDNSRYRPTVDHKVPKSKDGSDSPDNWILMHQVCNNLKSDRILYEDGTLERLTRKPKPVKVVHRSPCELCYDGRLLLKDETCPDCGSPPQPQKFPKWAQRSHKECDHSEYHCWYCVLGFVERKSALETIITG